MTLQYILYQDLNEVLFKDTINELTGGRAAIGSNPAVSGDDRKWVKLIDNTIERVKAYTRHWYDIDAEFVDFAEYSNSEAYATGQRVASVEDSERERELYLCIQDAEAGTLLTDTAYFEKTDTRNSMIVEMCCIIIAYQLHRRYNARSIPEQMRIDYEDAIKNLEDIQRGKIMLDLPQRENVESDDAGQEFASGEMEGLTQDSY